ncbi:MAG: VanW family protein [bacterium]|nr:VanW family protein [bacterium]
MKKDKKKINIIIFSASGCLLLGMGLYLTSYYHNLISQNKDRTYQGMSVNGFQIANVDINKLEDRLNQIEEETLNKEIKFSLKDKTVSLTLKDVSPTFNNDELIKNIKNDIETLSYKDKINYINGKKLKNYAISIDFNEESINHLIKKLSKEINTNIIKEKLTINKDHSVSYSSGSDGYKLDESKSKNIIIEFLKNNKENFLDSKEKNYSVELVGSVIKHDTSNLSTINKKISSFSTSFSNVGNRGYNIRYAVSFLNNTLIEPNGIFSFRKVVGPYSCANGFKTAPAQNSAGYACGGGVCQVATTMYNAQLLAGLKTTMRYSHGEAVKYVPKGQDATVYGDKTDYRFKNQYSYPILIVSYIENSKVVIDIWSNNNALDGKSFKVESTKNSKGGYMTYLLKYDSNGKLEEKKLLHTTYYKK